MSKSEGKAEANHVWHPHPGNSRFLLLQGFTNAVVDTQKAPNGRYLWQFRKVASYADTVEAARSYVEAGAEYFQTMHRNPYAA
jgi:hypothetical protein